MGAAKNPSLRMPGSRKTGRPPRLRGAAREASALHATQGVGVARVHVGDLAGDAGGEVRQQEGGGVAHFLDGDVAVQRGGGFDGCQDAGEALDAGGSQDLDGAGGDAVGADALGPQRAGQTTQIGRASCRERV